MRSGIGGRPRIPPEWKGRRIRLQFGAVDWQCKVIINGREVGQHRGGYDRFAFDITDCLHWDRPEEIVIVDTDPTEGDQPRGKQSLHPQGIFYSSNSGIWQTVWLEPVPEICIDGLWMTPDLDAKGLRLRVAVNSLADDLQVEAVASVNGAVVGRVTGRAGAEMLLPLDKSKLWSPDSPFLYDLEVTLKKAGQTVDRVSSYFGMRQVALLKDAEGIARIILNGRPLFQIGTLDQGFWPDGVYTAPTDDALRSDIAFLKAAGFNLTRKHVKIEPDRWYYWCDKLGLLVWQDMPSGNNATPEGQREFEAELLHMVKDLYNHPPSSFGSFSTKAGGNMTRSDCRNASRRWTPRAWLMTPAVGPTPMRATSSMAIPIQDRPQSNRNAGAPRSWENSADWG
jgi:beta-galactosidase/beta-glucuronidase